MIGFSLSSVVIVPVLISALVTIGVRSAHEHIKNKIIAKNIKKLIEVEIEKNYDILKNIESILDFLDDKNEGNQNIDIMNITEEDFETQYASQEEVFKMIKSLINSADRQANLLSTMIYKDIFLKSVRNFHSDEDRTIHTIYVSVIEIEKYKTFISTFSKDKNELEMYQAYFKIFNNVTNSLNDIESWKLIRKKKYNKFMDRLLLKNSQK